MAALLLLTSSGCASLSRTLNPYEEDFQCPRHENGKCVSIPDAYEESVRPEEVGGTAEKGKTEREGKKKGRDIANPDAESLYEKALYGEMARLIDEPETPLIAPPIVMRVLFLPYKDDEKDGELLFMYRYVFFIVDKPRWVMDSYLTPKE
jgi:conjugal transfer pilus assembly protein TraV